MARRPSKIFSQREYQVMNAVWTLKKASVKEIRKFMGGEKAGAYTSIATMLKFLESKGALRHEQIGRTYYYYPTSTKEQEQQKAVQYLLTQFFEDDVTQMLEKLFETIHPTEEDIECVEAFICDKRQS